MTGFPHIPGTCQFCGDTDDEDRGGQIDGDRFRWLTDRRNCCSRFECERAWAAKVKKEKEEIARRRRKRTPAEIEDLKKQERAARRRRRSLKGAA
jgi:hypothetical protein